MKTHRRGSKIERVPVKRLSRSAAVIAALVMSSALFGCTSQGDNDAAMDPAFTQYEFNPAEYDPALIPASFPSATVMDGGNVLSVRQIGGLGCPIEPVSFEQEAGDGTFRVIYNYVEPNPNGVCDAVAGYFGTDITMDDVLLSALHTVILVRPDGGETEVAIHST